MVSPKLYPLLLLLLFWSYTIPSLQAQNDTLQSDIEYYYPPKLQYQDAIYREDIATVLLHPKNNPYDEPLLPLQNYSSLSEQLLLSFDLLQDDAQVLSYTFLHCNADWQPSPLQYFDYLDGFWRNDIDNYTYSLGTNQPYVHYELLFPNNYIKLKKSGNYLLIVYTDNNPDQPILTKRFMVYEQSVIGINTQLITPAIADFYTLHQQIQFSVSYNSIDVFNPITDVKATVLQNGRWDNALTQLTPTFILPNELRYEYIGKNLFPAGNRFRFFDMRTLPQQWGEHIRTVTLDKANNTHVFLTPDKPQQQPEARVRVSGQAGIGKFSVGRLPVRFSVFNADYAFVHFNLQMDSPITNGNVYVVGAFTQWQPLPQYQLRYNYQQKAYQCTLYLKQGLYHYQYAIQADRQKALQTDELEGNLPTNRNTYHILVYFRNLVGQYDRLVGMMAVNPN